MIVDASVAFKWFAGEEGGDRALDLIGREEILAPVLMLAEIGNALWKKALREQIDPHASFEAELASLSSLVAIRDESAIVPRALEMARALSHPVYDCIYLALAEAEEARLVTADGRFLERVAASRWRGMAEAL